MNGITLQEIESIAFPMARRAGEGYLAAEVDDFVDQLSARIRRGEDIMGLARSVRFRMAR